MPSTPPTQKRLLFVDDDVTFLQVVGELFGTRGKGRWHIHLADTTARALATLQDQSVDIVVIDLQMPVVDGEQFLQLLNRKYPNLRKVVMSGMATPAQRASCLSNGAELCLEKPRSSEGFESVFAAIDELINLQPQDGFRGLLRQVGLQDVLQMECLSRNSSVLQVATAQVRGEIFIKDGQIIHAFAGTTKGDSAFNYLLGLRGGDFSLKPFHQPPEQSITGQWEFLIMEAARRRDEAADVTAAHHPDRSAGVDAPVPAAELGQAEPDPEPCPSSAASAGPENPETAALVTLPRRVEEFLVCSPQGEVLHQWQCRNIPTRLKLFEFILQKAGQLAERMPLGSFDRLEILHPKRRIVAILKADRHLLVVSTPAAGEVVS